MIAFFQIGSDYKLPGFLIFAAYVVYLISVTYLERNKMFFIGVFASLFVLGGAYKMQKDFWIQRNAEVCERLSKDEHCQLTENGYSCNEQSSFGEFKTAKTMCSSSATN